MDPEQEPTNLTGVPLPENVNELGVSFESVANEFAGTVKATPNMPHLFQHDETSESISQATKHAKDASTLISLVIAGSVNINQEANNCLRSCELEIGIAVEALTTASTRLLEAVVASATQDVDPSDQSPTPSNF